MSLLKRIFNYIKSHSLKDIIKRIFGISTLPKKGEEYQIWINNNEFKPKEIIKLSKFVPKYNYKFSFLLDDNVDDLIIDSINQQSYSNFEIIKFNKKDNINKIIDKSSGDYIIIIYNNCILSPFALYEIIKEIEKTKCDAIYSDSDYIDLYNKNGKKIEKRYNPIFRVDLGIDTLRSTNYVGKLLVINKKLLKTGRIELDNRYYNVIYDAMFKLYENKLAIKHIPKVLYHELENVNNYNQLEEIEIINQHLKRIDIDGKVENGLCEKQYKIIYKIKENVKVSIIIPNMDHIDDLKKCIESIKKSTYNNYEIIIIENNSKKEETFKYYNALIKDEKIKVIKYDIEYFNFSKIINYGVEQATGDYIILLNNDVEIISKDWIENMLMYAQREDIGIVGVKLLFSDNSIQHAGVVIGIRGLAGHIYREISENEFMKYPNINLIQNLSAVTAACMMFKKNIFNLVGKFEEGLAVNFNDVDFCLKIREKGLLVVYNPIIVGYHYESKSRGVDTETEEKRINFNKEYNMFTNKWKEIIKLGDPYYNKNYRLDTDIPIINHNKIVY